MHSFCDSAKRRSASLTGVFLKKTLTVLPAASWPSMIVRLEASARILTTSSIFWLVSCSSTRASPWPSPSTPLRHSGVWLASWLHAAPAHASAHMPTSTALLHPHHARFMNRPLCLSSSSLLLCALRAFAVLLLYLRSSSVCSPWLKTTRVLVDLLDLQVLQRVALAIEGGLARLGVHQDRPQVGPDLRHAQKLHLPQRVDRLGLLGFINEALLEHLALARRGQQVLHRSQLGRLDGQILRARLHATPGLDRIRIARHRPGRPRRQRRENRPGRQPQKPQARCPAFVIHPCPPPTPRA